MTARGGRTTYYLGPGVRSATVIERWPVTSWPYEAVAPPTPRHTTGEPRGRVWQTCADARTATRGADVSPVHAHS